LPLDATWTPESNLAVADLLDHLAEELAREYVRLMEAASSNELGCEMQPRSGGGVAMRAAIYARYSSENQRPESNEPASCAGSNSLEQRMVTGTVSRILANEKYTGRWAGTRPRAVATLGRDGDGGSRSRRRIGWFRKTILSGSCPKRSGRRFAQGGRKSGEAGQAGRGAADSRKSRPVVKCNSRRIFFPGR